MIGFAKLQGNGAIRSTSAGDNMSFDPGKNKFVETQGKKKLEEWRLL